MKCPYCHSPEQQVKAGRTESGSQRYKCQTCQRRYTPVPKEQGYAAALRQQALQLYIDDMNLRRIARHLGVVHQTIANWVKAYAATLPEQPPLPTLHAVIEQDELFTFVGSKKRSLRHDAG